MEILISAIHPGSEAGGGWSCPDEEVLNSGHAMLQQRGWLYYSGSNKSPLSCLPTFTTYACLHEASSVSSWRWGQGRPRSPALVLKNCSIRTNRTVYQALAHTSNQLGRQRVVSWFIFQDGKDPKTDARARGLAFIFPREE